MTGLERSGLWADARGMPDAVARTLDDADGFADLAAMLSGARRVVATGNGAALYAATSLWLAALRTPGAGPEVVAVPAGLLAQNAVAWRPGDLLLAVSSSGELRDVVAALDAGAPRPYAAITATPGSTIGAGAAARALVTVHRQEAVTHTQAFVGNVATALAVWAVVTGDEPLREAVALAPGALAAALDAAPAWGASAAQRAGPVAGLRSSLALGDLAAALETALLLAEVAGLPAQGLETREGATTGMYALRRGDVVLSLPTGPDPWLAEAEATCARTGAAVLRVPGGDRVDPRLAPITTFPAVLAFATLLGLQGGRDVDRPGWVDAYYATARTDTGEAK